MKKHLNKKMVLFIEIIPYIEFIYHIDMFYLNQNLLPYFFYIFDNAKYSITPYYPQNNYFLCF